VYTCVGISFFVSFCNLPVSVLFRSSCRLMCGLLAVGMWQWAMLLTWAHELPPVRLCAASGRPYWPFICSVTAHVQSEHAARYRR
jgi:hypothetical protein